jgi:microcystin-dependent protein
LSDRQLGETGGVESVSLLPAQMPAHQHSLHATTAMGNSTLPTDALPARPSIDGPDGPELAEARIYRKIAPNTSLGSAALAMAGGSQPHENMNPYLGLNCIIALYGVYPQMN